MFVHSSTDLLLSFRHITDHTSTLLESTKSQRKEQRKLLRTCNFSSAASPSPRGEPLKLQDSIGGSSPSCWEGPSLLFRVRSVLKHTHTHTHTQQNNQTSSVDFPSCIFSQPSDRSVPRGCLGAWLVDASGESSSSSSHRLSLINQQMRVRGTRTLRCHGELLGRWRALPYRNRKYYSVSRDA